MVSSSATVEKQPAISVFQSGILACVALVAILGGFLFGYDTVVINGANQYLKVHFLLNPSQEGFAGASAIAGCIPGALFAGFFSDRFGRRKVLFVCAILYALSGLLSAVPRTFDEFLLARFASGLSIGVSSMICPVYIAEMAPPLWRGRLGSLFQLGIVSGIFISLFANAFIQRMGDDTWNAASGWRWMLGSEVVPAIFLLAVLFPAKESPRWLIQMNREDTARGILESIGGAAYAGEEIAAVRDVLKQEESNMLELLSHARFRRPLIIAVLLMAFSQFSGINAIMYYSTEIFTTAHVGVKDAFAASTVIGLVNLLFTFVAIALVDKVGRRPLLLVGLTAQVIALGCAGWMFHTNANGIGLLVAIVSFIAAFAMALGPIPWILCSEIFPMRIRGRAMSVATFVIWISCYIVASTFPVLNNSPHFGPALTFWIYGICSALAFIFVFVMVPETKGRSLEEIETRLMGTR
ncbi:MAG TPA: sugar porter family MFS transporter [Verrucomicrobiae bacterium]|jgi:SP family arabinose:H+ symporter-like MFS transporter|nr:sugar porter family MFS transporter [Verrucomicrobiae bacterium]